MNLQWMPSGLSLLVIHIVMTQFCTAQNAMSGLSDMYVCVWQLFEDVVSVLDPEMLEHGRDSSDELTASYSDVSSTDHPAVHDEQATPDPQPQQAAEQ